MENSENVGIITPHNNGCNNFAHVHRVIDQRDGGAWVFSLKGTSI